MKRSSKLPIFSGHCRAADLTAATRYEATRAIVAGLRRAHQSRRADNLLPVLLALLVLAAIAH